MINVDEIVNLACLQRELARNRSLTDKVRMHRAVGLITEAGLLRQKNVERLVESEGEVPGLFLLLIALGRGDLSIARLYEGHVNALQLIARLGTREQIDIAGSYADQGRLIGVWGADDPNAPARLELSSGGVRLSGRKTFASGAGRVGLAVVAVKTAEAATQLVLIPDIFHTDRIDPSGWVPIGMQATDSFAISLDGLSLPATSQLGQARQFEQQPFFGAGAIRFVAAQLGGLLAVWDAARRHLTKTDRHKNAHQAHRLGEMAAEMEASYAFVRDAYVRVAPAIAWKAIEISPSFSLVADSARSFLELSAERTIASAYRCVGCAGMMDTHPLSVAARDLLVYLKQPAPDAARTRVGIAAADGSYRLNFDAL